MSDTFPESKMTCVRIPGDLRAALEQYCEINRLGISEVLRGLVHQLVTGQVVGVTEGYLQGRSIAIPVVLAAVKEALDHMPPTYDEAVARLGILPP